MKKITFLVFIALALVPSVCAAHPHPTQVFFLPDQGFIRVDSQIEITIHGNNYHFQLFPDAQITALWLPGLAGYSLEHSERHTIVTVTLQEPVYTPLLLELSYEGFLAQDTLTSHSLDQSTQWFPFFSKPIRTGPFQITVPEGVSTGLPGTLRTTSTSTYKISIWDVEDDIYPVLTFALAAKALPSPPGFSESLESAARQLPVLESIPSSVAAVEPLQEPAEALEDRRPSERTTDDQAVTLLERQAVDATELFVDAVNSTDYATVSNMLADEFSQPTRFLAFLRDRPAEYEQLALEIMDVSSDGGKTIVGAQLSIGESFLESQLVWQPSDRGGQLIEFQMWPARSEIDTGIENALRQWLDCFHQAIHSADWSAVRNQLAMPDDHQEAILSFFQSIGAQYDWELHAISLKAMRITALVRTRDYGRYRVLYGFAPTDDGWALTDLQAIPFW